MKKVILRVARTAALAYLGLMLFLAGCQNRLLYFPSRGTEAALLTEAQANGLEPWKNAQGEIVGWRKVQPQAKRRIVAFHGNAGYALHRDYYVEGLSGLDWEVYLFEYPGYGARAGSPGREAFLSTSRAAVEELLAADPRPLYLLGESIGSGVACGLAAELKDRVRGLLLVIPFARLVEVAKWHFPYLPVGLILRDKFDNLSALESYEGPVVIAIAEKDEVIPAEQGRKLHEAYRGSKLLITFAGATHNNFPNHARADWWKEATAFFVERP